MSTFDAKRYREHLHKVRTHPSDSEDWVDQRDNFMAVYFTVAPFVAVEYLAEVSYEVLPPGLIFPMGFLLFWAFYYTYYKPGYLEERLTEPAQWNLAVVPGLVLGLAIWFVKVTLSELLGFFSPRAAAPTPGTAPRRHPNRTVPLPDELQAFVGVSRTPLPQEVLAALRVLGLDEGATWGDIQHRYRQLAKRYHPDLNPDITTSGTRFMLYHAAYEKLLPFRARFSSVLR